MCSLKLHPTSYAQNCFTPDTDFFSFSLSAVVTDSGQTAAAQLCPCNSCKEKEHITHRESAGYAMKYPAF